MFYFSMDFIAVSESNKVVSFEFETNLLTLKSDGNVLLPVFSNCDIKHKMKQNSTSQINKLVSCY